MNKRGTAEFPGIKKLIRQKAKEDGDKKTGEYIIKYIENNKGIKCPRKQRSNTQIITLD